MAEELVVDKSLSKSERYESLLPQISGLIDGEDDLIANLANVSSALKYSLDYFWVGFYLVKDEELVLGPFQGPVACTRIGYGRGVCGKAWENNKNIIVENVDEFPGHIACSADSKSEIVLVLRKGEKAVAILDIDSDEVGTFDELDERYLEKICSLLEQKF